MIPRCWERICLPRINYLTLATLLYDNGLGWCVSALHTCTPAQGKSPSGETTTDGQMQRD